MGEGASRPIFLDKLNPGGGVGTRQVSTEVNVNGPLPSTLTAADCERAILAALRHVAMNQPGSTLQVGFNQPAHRRLIVQVAVYLIHTYAPAFLVGSIYRGAFVLTQL